MNKTLDQISEQLTEAIKSIQPHIRNEYNRVVLSTKKEKIIIPKQANSIRSSSGSRSV